MVITGSKGAQGEKPERQIRHKEGEKGVEEEGNERLFGSVSDRRSVQATECAGEKKRGEAELGRQGCKGRKRGAERSHWVTFWAEGRIKLLVRLANLNFENRDRKKMTRHGKKR